MGYSIYISVKPDALNQIEENPQDFPYLSEFFKPKYTQKIDNGYLFAWIKPYRDGNQSQTETAFFNECLLLDNAGNLARIAHDETINGDSLESKCPEQLHKYIGMDVL